MYLVYPKYWTLNLNPLMVYPKVPFPPSFIILRRHHNSLSAFFALFPSMHSIRAGEPAVDGDNALQVVRCRQLGINAIVILEQFNEVDILLDVASCLAVLPVIGVRAKLTTRHGGHWCEVRQTSKSVCLLHGEVSDSTQRKPSLDVAAPRILQMPTAVLLTSVSERKRPCCWTDLSSAYFDLDCSASQKLLSSPLYRCTSQI